jgi:hypothetical protein
MRVPSWAVVTALVLGLYLMLLALKPLHIDTLAPSHGLLRVLESAEQHKYARLAAFAHSNVASRRLPKGFAPDDALSTDEHTVFVSDRELVVGFRGTVDHQDVVTNAHILIGQERDTERFQRSEQVARDARRRHPDPPRFTLVGYSLGGAIAVHVGLTLGVPSHTFNPALGAAALARLRHVPESAPQTVYRTPLDHVSAPAVHLARLGRLPVTVVVVQNAPGAEPHGLHNFYSDDAVPQPDGKLLVTKEPVHITARRYQVAVDTVNRTITAVIDRLGMSAS